MKVGIDASLCSGQRVGVGVYASKLIENLAKIDSENEYIIFPFNSFIFEPNYKNYRKPNNVNFSVLWEKYSDYRIKNIWHGRNFIKRFFLPNLDIYHATSFTMPCPNISKRTVFTVHDLSFYTHPQFHKKENIDHCLKETTKAIKEADIILADSENTKSDLINYLDCTEDKIKVIYLACEERFFKKLKMIEINKKLNKYSLNNKKYIFHLGSLEPRKNTLGLIKAYRFLNDEIRDKYKLVIGGASGWLNSEIFDYIDKYNLKESIKMLGYVEDADLPALYQGAKLFAYPSFYEGFGIPVLEAMASRCPVITANNSSLPEIGGSAVEYCDPLDVEMISVKITALLNNKNKLNMMRNKSIKKAREFSWEKTAKNTLAVYINLMKY